MLSNEEFVIALRLQINVDSDQNTAASNKTTENVWMVDRDRLFCHIYSIIF